MSAAVILPSGSGVVFPNDGKDFEKRSTTKCAKTILAASLGAASAQNKAAANNLRQSKDSSWRFGYQPHLRAVVDAMANPNDTVACAGAGLRAVHDEFQFHRDGEEKEISMKDAMTPGRFPNTFRTGVVAGSGGGDGSQSVAAVPYQGKSYTGSSLHDLAKKFVATGEAEASFADSVGEVASSPTALAPPADGVFVLIGATSEMGPCETLLKSGATVIALARKAGRGGAKRWEELIQAATNSPGGGKLICPVGISTTGSQVISDFSASDVGADALVHTPEIVNWLVELFTVHPLCKGKRPLIYSGIYLDGGKFVRASVAMEFIVHELSERLVASASSAKAPALLYIDTPSHFHLLPTADAKPKYTGDAAWWLKTLSAVGLVKGPHMRKSSSSPSDQSGSSPVSYTVCDFSSLQQGPNYAVAKMIQRWRAVWSRHSGASLYQEGSLTETREKQLVSITTGPAAKTESVMHAKTMALMMKNVHMVPPNVAHEPETVRALMTLVMLQDLQSAKALGNPQSSKAAGGEGEQKDVHPMRFTVENAWHGGLWRSPYSMDSAGPYVVGMALYGKAITSTLAVVGAAAVYGALRLARIL